MLLLLWWHAHAIAHIIHRRAGSLTVGVKRLLRIVVVTLEEFRVVFLLYGHTSINLGWPGSFITGN